MVFNFAKFINENYFPRKFSGTGLVGARGNTNDFGAGDLMCFIGSAANAQAIRIKDFENIQPDIR